jgi:hypothetical protein
VLEAANGDGVRLSSASPAPTVDALSVAALVKLADDAAARLQKEASAAVTKGEVESLQAITAANAPLSRDVLSFKETADRLRGLAAAPRLGAGALDPNVVLPGQAPRAATAKTAEKQLVRTELRDFQGLDQANTGRGKKLLLLVGMVALVALAANAFYFGVPRMQAVATEPAGKNVQSIDVHGPGAVVVINQEWIDNGAAELPRLVEVLRQRQVTRAMLMTANGRPAGVVLVDTGKIIGLPAPSTRKK